MLRYHRKKKYYQKEKTPKKENKSQSKGEREIDRKIEQRERAEYELSLFTTTLLQLFQNQQAPRQLLRKMYFLYEKANKGNFFERKEKKDNKKAIKKKKGHNIYIYKIKQGCENKEVHEGVLHLYPSVPR